MLTSRQGLLIVLWLAGCHRIFPYPGPPERSGDAQTPAQDLSSADLPSAAHEGALKADAPTASSCPKIDEYTVAFYSFEQHLKEATDPSKNGDLKRPDVFSPSPSYESSPCGEALSFLPNNNLAPDIPPFHVQLPPHEDWKLDKGSIDLLVWFSGDISPEHLFQGILSRDADKKDLPGHFTLFRALPHADNRMESNGDILCVRLQGINDDAHPQSNYACTQGVQKDQWHQLGINFGGGSLELWVDGQLNQLEPVRLYPDMLGLEEDKYCIGRADTTGSDGIDGNENPWVLGASSINTQRAALIGIRLITISLARSTTCASATSTASLER